MSRPTSPPEKNSKNMPRIAELMRYAATPPLCMAAEGNLVHADNPEVVIRFAKAHPNRACPVSTILI